MTDTFATCAAPAWATTCWADDNAIYVQLPCKDGPPYVVKYAFTENGLSRALGLMRDLHRKQAEPYIPCDHPLVRKVGTPATTDQRTSARNVLRRLKII